jgi:hypothetical protein
MLQGKRWFVNLKGMPPSLEEVFRLYKVPADQRAEIIHYAAQHPGVAQALWEAAPELKKVFGKARRRLELEVDPESGWERLLGMVLLKDYPTGLTTGPEFGLSHREHEARSRRPGKYVMVLQLSSPELSSSLNPEP